MTCKFFSFCLVLTKFLKTSMQSHWHCVQHVNCDWISNGYSGSFLRTQYESAYMGNNVTFSAKYAATAKGNCRHDTPLIHTTKINSFEKKNRCKVNLCCSSWYRKVQISRTHSFYVINIFNQGGFMSTSCTFFLFRMSFNQKMHKYLNLKIYIT